MKNIEIKKIVQAIETSDGAGVKLKRSIRTPEAEYIDPFLMLDEFGSENKDDYIAGFPPHPHRGIETVTYMLKGEFEHQDSTGAKGIMSSGDVQWMKTGRGIIHSEMPAMSDGKLLGFQLWVNMPAQLKKNKPEYLYIKSNELGVHKDIEKTVKVIAGKYEKAEGPEKNHNVDPIHGSMPNISQKPRKTILIQLYSGKDKIIGGSNHTNVQLVLQGWNYNSTRKTAEKL